MTSAPLIASARINSGSLDVRLDEILHRTRTFSQHRVPGFRAYQAARDCYHSAEYRAAMDIRKNVSVGDIIIIEGYEGRQPGD